MPRKIDASHRGCLVKGAYMKVDGTRGEGEVIITPEKAGLFEGVVYERKPIPVNVQPNGMYEIRLPPSSVVGRYQISMGGLSFVFEVPDNKESAFLKELLEQ